jgi:phage I-like protein
MTRDELVARKAQVDERLSKLKVRLKTWKVEARAMGKYRPPGEYLALETEVANLGQISQRLQTAIGDFNRADKHGSNVWFEIAAKELLPHHTFLAIVERSTEMREKALAQVGFSSGEKSCN